MNIWIVEMYEKRRGPHYDRLDLKCFKTKALAQESVFRFLEDYSSNRCYSLSEQFIIGEIE